MPRTQTALVTLERIQFAAGQIRGVAVRTPLLPWEDGVWLKPESLQPVGAFKMRGAYFRLSTLTDDERAAGVITYSSGNHAQAVARAARLLGIHAVIVVPGRRLGSARPCQMRPAIRGRLRRPLPTFSLSPWPCLRTPPTA